MNWAAGGLSASVAGLVTFGLWDSANKDRDDSGLDDFTGENALDRLENGTNTPPTTEVYVEGDYDDWVFTGESVTHSFTGTTSDGTNWLGHFQKGLDFIGLVPVFGEVADGINAIIYLSQGDYLNAGLSGAAMLPIGGQFATAGKFANKAFDLSKGAAKGGTKLLNQFNSAESLIQGAGKLSPVKGGFQGFVKGDGASIFNNLTHGAKPLPNGRFLLSDGTNIGKHFSSNTGVFTINMNRDGKIFKIRINQ